MDGFSEIPDHFLDIFGPQKFRKKSPKMSLNVCTTERFEEGKTEGTKGAHPRTRTYARTLKLGVGILFEIQVVKRLICNSLKRLRSQKVRKLGRNIPQLSLRPMAMTAAGFSKVPVCGVRPDRKLTQNDPKTDHTDLSTLRALEE